MSENSHVSRRQFLQAAALLVGSAAVNLEAAQPTPARSIIGFSKVFAHLNPEETAEVVAEVGWDGIDCPVRQKATHIRPERIEEDLPKMVESLRRHGKEVSIVTTDVLRVDAETERILRTIAGLGIKRYRLGFLHYTSTQSIPETLRNFGAALKDLAALNRELGLQAGYQNHSGSDYVGGPIWDIWSLIEGLDASSMGLCFDIGQAMIEGGLSWPVQARLTQTHWTALQVKDFVWERDAKKGWIPRWCPLGEGRLLRKFFEDLNTSGFKGPISQHHEHLQVGIPRAELLDALKKDHLTLRSFLG